MCIRLTSVSGRSKGVILFSQDILWAGCIRLRRGLHGEGQYSQGTRSKQPCLELDYHFVSTNSILVFCTDSDTVTWVTNSQVWWLECLSGTDCFHASAWELFGSSLTHKSWQTRCSILGSLSVPRNEARWGISTVCSIFSYFLVVGSISWTLSVIWYLQLVLDKCHHFWFFLQHPPRLIAWIERRRRDPPEGCLRPRSPKGGYHSLRV